MGRKYRYIKLVLKGKKSLIRRISRRQLYEYFYRIAQEKEPFPWKYLPFETYRRTVGESCWAIVANMMAKKQIIK